MTFRDLEKLASVVWLSENNPSSLTEWYLSVRDTPLTQLGVGDVCRALRQNLFVSEVLPVAVVLLTNDVLAGERYDGELVAALASLNAECWQESPHARQKTICALAEVKNLSQDVEVLRDTSTLMTVLGEYEKGGRF
ncbi:contact-dependent growth inhibition system immunity protein [Pseudomonas fluorescens]|jgi:hypothetical protein|uniref:contact-dependent growth inhibition system immunity protein n=1 Tax=Pseudomonas fluorescens TaxID=294 RepID=UPI002786A0BE|nr:contact-dependent growth inhibition system immunity protein [Pseudomonas fluorescens]MDP9781400.1 hypothetical protein [Pseudomonas fluorescens]